MFKTFAIASLAAVAFANTNKDDTTGIFPGDEQWKSGHISISSNSDIFYWGFESRHNPD